MPRMGNVITNIKFAIRPVHIVAQLFGLAPYSFARHPVNNEEDIDISWNTNYGRVIWSALLLILQTVGIIYRLAFNFVRPPTSISELLSNVIYLPFIRSTGILAVLFALKNRTKMLQIITRLSSVDTFLFKSNDKVYRKHNLFLVVVLTCCAVYILPLYFEHHWRSGGRPAEYILVLSHVTWLINDLQYLNLLVILKDRLVSLNDKLRSVFKVDSYNRGEFKIPMQPVSQGISESISQSEFRLHSVFVRRSFQISLTPELPFSHNISEIASEILTFRLNYNALYEICGLINSMHGCIILFNWSVYTVNFIINLYYVTISSFYTSASDKVLTSTIVNVTLILSIILSLIRMSIIAVFCQWTSDEHQRCLSNVQDLELMYCTEEDILIQLESFSDQLANNKIEFTACGIFPMNLSVLCTVIGLVIQYLIFLFQMIGLSEH